MRTVIAILVLTLTTSLSQGAPTKQRQKANSGDELRRQKEATAARCKELPHLYLGRRLLSFRCRSAMPSCAIPSMR